MFDKFSTINMIGQQIIFIQNAFWLKINQKKQIERVCNKIDVEVVFKNQFLPF